MIIAAIKGATRILGKSQGYLGLPLRDVITNDTVNGPDTPAMVTAWTPTPDEVARIIKGHNVILRVLGTSHPPVMVLVDTDGPEAVAMPSDDEARAAMETLTRYAASRDATLIDTMIGLLT